jgi:hypothetical protein
MMRPETPEEEADRFSPKCRLKLIGRTAARVEENSSQDATKAIQNPATQLQTTTSPTHVIAGRKSLLEDLGPRP